MPNFTALYSFYCRPMESDDTWITTGFLIDTRFYGFLRCSGGRVERVFFGAGSVVVVYMRMIARGTRQL